MICKVDGTVFATSTNKVERTTTLGANRFKLSNVQGSLLHKFGISPLLRKNHFRGSIISPIYCERSE